MAWKYFLFSLPCNNENKKVSEHSFSHKAAFTSSVLFTQILILSVSHTYKNHGIKTRKLLQKNSQFHSLLCHVLPFHKWHLEVKAVIQGTMSLWTSSSIVLIPNVGSLTHHNSHKDNISSRTSPLRSAQIKWHTSVFA